MSSDTLVFWGRLETLPSVSREAGTDRYAAKEDSSVGVKLTSDLHYDLWIARKTPVQ